MRHAAAFVVAMAASLAVGGAAAEPAGEWTIESPATRIEVPADAVSDPAGRPRLPPPPIVLLEAGPEAPALFGQPDALVEGLTDVAAIPRNLPLDAGYFQVERAIDVEDFPLDD